MPTMPVTNTTTTLGGALTIRGSWIDQYKVGDDVEVLAFVKAGGLEVWRQALITGIEGVLFVNVFLEIGDDHYAQDECYFKATIRHSSYVRFPVEKKPTYISVPTTMADLMMVMKPNYSTCGVTVYHKDCSCVVFYTHNNLDPTMGSFWCDAVRDENKCKGEWIRGSLERYKASEIAQLFYTEMELEGERPMRIGWKTNVGPEARTAIHYYRGLIPMDDQEVADYLRKALEDKRQKAIRNKDAFKK